MPIRLSAELAMLGATGLTMIDHRRDAQGACQSLLEVRYLTDRDQVVMAGLTLSKENYRAPLPNFAGGPGKGLAVSRAGK